MHIAGHCRRYGTPGTGFPEADCGTMFLDAHRTRSDTSIVIFTRAVLATDAPPVTSACTSTAAPYGPLIVADEGTGSFMASSKRPGSSSVM